MNYNILARFFILGCCTLGITSVRAATAPAVSEKTAAPESRLCLWYDKPASKWTEALPIGNGRLGGMIYGGKTLEHIQFNEDSVWTGKPHDYSHAGAAEYLEPIRKLLWEGKQREAEKLAMDHFMSVPLHQRRYQPCGDLIIDFHKHENITDYQRKLDLATAVHYVTYKIGDTEFQRETFASFPNQAIISHISSSVKGSISCSLSLISPHAASRTEISGNNRIILKGKVQDDGVAFESHLLIKAEGGTVVKNGSRLKVENADSLTLILTAASNVKSWKSLDADPSRICSTAIDAASNKSYKEILTDHITDYKQLFSRVSISLGSKSAGNKPTDKRIEDFNKGNDPDLAALVFQYGRYLLIACSRPGSQPANLQGLWNDRIKPPWDSKYTCNINTEMNYWPTEVTALSECHDPLFRALGELKESGTRTAKVHYNARGWVLHHNFDMWRGTAPINRSNHGIWVTGGAWLSLHLWERYLFTQDKEFLRTTAYPILKGSALFFTDFLVKDPKSGKLISGPSNSPEHGGLVMGPTMDHQIIRSLFRATAEAGEILGEDKDFNQKLLTMIPEIAPNKIGKHGQLQEWLEDRDNPKDHHRHVSHLWGVYPGNDINWKDTPDMWKAARQSLIYRGDTATGWSMGWKICLWARFLDGNHTYKILQNLLAPVGTRGKGGLYPNLFDAHPPFQIDGNFGACAGIAEMLLQSHLGEIHLLPALPDAWPKGEVKGLKARGGYSVDITWKEGKLVKVILISSHSGLCPVRYGGKLINIKTTVNQPVELTPQSFLP